MFLLFIILFMCVCLMFVVFFVKIKLLEDEIDSLYDNYSDLLQKSFRTNPRDNLEVLKND